MITVHAVCLIEALTIAIASRQAYEQNSGYTSDSIMLTNWKDIKANLECGYERITILN